MGGGGGWKNRRVPAVQSRAAVNGKLRSGGIAFGCAILSIPSKDELSLLGGLQGRILDRLKVGDET